MPIEIVRDMFEHFALRTTLLLNCLLTELWFGRTVTWHLWQPLPSLAFDWNFCLMTRTKLASVCFVAARNCMRQQVAGRSSQRHATLPTYYTVVLRTEKVLLCTTLYYKVLIQYYSVLQSTTPVLLCTTKYYSSTTLYYTVLLQYYSVLHSATPVLLCTTPVLLCTTKYYSSITRYYSGTRKYYSSTTPVLQSTNPVLLCTTKYYSSTTLYYKVLLQYYSVLQ